MSGRTVFRMLLSIHGLLYLSIAIAGVSFTGAAVVPLLDWPVAATYIVGFSCVTLVGYYARHV